MTEKSATVIGVKAAVEHEFLEAQQGIDLPAQVVTPGLHPIMDHELSRPNDAATASIVLPKPSAPGAKSISHVGLYENRPEEEKKQNEEMAQDNDCVISGSAADVLFNQGFGGGAANQEDPGAAPEKLDKKIEQIDDIDHKFQVTMKQDDADKIEE